MAEYSVKVHIYDLSKGLARSLSPGLLGMQIDGIWHTGIVVYGREYFFGGDGIMNCPPCGTVLGRPDTSVDLGVTQVPKEMFVEYLQDLSTSTFSYGTYHLLDHNCNSFSNEVAQFLTGNPIPSYITNLPQEVMNTPFGAMIRPMLDSMQVNPSGNEAPMFASNSPPENACSNQATAKASAAATGLGKPILYDDLKVTTGFSSIAAAFKDKVTPHEFHTLMEVVEYVKAKSVSWSLGSAHMTVIAHLAQKADLTDKQRGAVCGLLRVALLRDDVIAYVTHDPGHHLMTLLHKYETLSRQVQLSLVRAVCNLSSEKAGHVWMMSADKWDVQGGRTSNSQVTITTCVTSLLHGDAEVTKSGTSLAYNLTFHKVAPDVAVELGGALIQSLIKTLNPPSPETCLATLQACMETSAEVTGLAAVMGLDVMRFAATSPACAAICRKINERLETFSI